MRTSAKLGLTAMMAVVLLSVAVTTASARSFQLSEFSFRVHYSSWEFTGPSTVRCRLTLEGRYHSRTIVKTRGSLIGAITGARIAFPCTNGEAWVDNGVESEPLGTAPNKLPAHLTYESFAGTLPNIQEINDLFGRFSFVMQSTILGLTCRGRYGRAEDNIIFHGVREASGGITSLNSDASINRFSLVEQLGPNAVCPATVAIRAAGPPELELSTELTVKTFLI
jgi:hypothetical protein